MDEESLQASFDCLGLSVDASLDEVERAFLELRNLYSAETLATYSLFDEADRQEKLAALKNAYERIRQAQAEKPDEETLPAQEEKPPVAKPLRANVDADLRQSPGLFLQQSRQVLGLSLQDVAKQTKVRSSLLQSIEEQRFDFLPAPVYLRGFVREFARMVKVPEIDALVDAFMGLYESDQQA